jgi:hypothetical protein
MAENEKSVNDIFADILSDFERITALGDSIVAKYGKSE